MNSAFFDKSRDIANSFVQSFLFVDDEIYPDPSKADVNHNLDAQRLTQAFSKAKKLCAFNNPRNENDFTDVIEVAKKADISILDWKIDLIKEQDEGTDEEDVEEDDPRGAFTLKLIEQILLDKETSGTFKLILIYTGELNLNEIVEKVRDQFQLIKVADNIVGKENIRIVIAGKPSLKGRLNHAGNFREWVIDYDDLPVFLLHQFTLMTSGLVSNVALNAISALRKNSFKILQQYNKSLDSAFLSHRAMLPAPDDAGELLKESIIDSFGAILDYDQIEELVSYENIKDWIDYNNFSEQVLSLQKKQLKLNTTELKKWQHDGFQKAVLDIWAKQFPDTQLEQKKIDTKYRELHKSQEEYFLPNGTPSSRHHEEFSILTHQKSNFALPSYVPKLSLGSVVKGKKSNNYWLCIQQKCDSIRIPQGEARRFLFLPLLEVTGNSKFNFLVNYNDEYIKLKVDFSSHKLRTIKFTPNKNGVVKARKYGKSTEYFFCPLHFKSRSNNVIDQNYTWVMDLKDFHAQRVANHFASVLSRIGLDESEWLRRWSS